MKPSHLCIAAISKTFMTLSAVGALGAISFAAPSASAQEVVVVDDYPPPEYIATVEPVYYENHATYWYGNHWYYRDYAGWHHYGSEPAFLYDRRLNSPPARWSYEPWGGGRWGGHGGDWGGHGGDWGHGGGYHGGADHGGGDHGGGAAHGGHGAPGALGGHGTPATHGTHGTTPAPSAPTHAGPSGGGAAHGGSSGGGGSHGGGGHGGGHR
jgi:hypothetical protein